VLLTFVVCNDTTTSQKSVKPCSTRKITRAIAKIALGLQDKLFLGNPSAQRDWGHAKDYITSVDEELFNRKVGESYLEIIKQKINAN